MAFIYFVILPLLMAIFFLNNAVFSMDEEVDWLAKRRNQTIEKCCPHEVHRIYGSRTMYCCLDGLFAEAGEKPPLWECEENGELNQEQIMETIQCAQRELHAERGVDICKVPCCELFQNVEPASETMCSRKCAGMIKKVDMTRHKLIHGLRQCHRLAPIHFMAFQFCIRQQQIDANANNGNSESTAVAKTFQEQCSEAIDIVFSR